MGIFCDRLEQVMMRRGLAATTQYMYEYWVRRYVAYFMRAPDQLGLNEIEEFQYALAEEEVLLAKKGSPGLYRARSSRSLCGWTPQLISATFKRSCRPPGSAFVPAWVREPRTCPGLSSAVPRSASGASSFRHGWLQ